MPSRCRIGIGLGVACAIYVLQVAGPAVYSPLGIDEQVSYYIASGHQPATVFARATEQSATPPAYFWLASASTSLHSGIGLTREFWLRFPAFGLGLASVAFICFFTRSWGTGVAAAILLAIHPQLVFHATQARPYAIGVFANLIAGWAIYRLRQPGWSVIHLALLILSNALLLWSHYLFALSIAVQPLLWILAFPVREQAEDEANRPLTGRQKTRETFGIFPGILLSLLSLISLVPLTSGVLRLQAQASYLNWVTQTRPWFEIFELLSFTDEPVAQLWTWLPILAAMATAHFFRIFRKADAESDRGHERWTQIGFLVVWAMGPIVLLWVAGLYLDPALAQTRYAAAQLGPIAVLFATLFRRLGGNFGAIAGALVLACAVGTPFRIIEKLQNPVLQDNYWQQAAALLNERAKDGDLVLVQSGLVETRLVPLQYADPGYQEYTTSRLSDFYLNVAVEKLSLPLAWSGPQRPVPEWQQTYEAKLRRACQEEHSVWLVLSADSDIGELTEASSRRWLAQLGMSVEIISDQRVARVLRAQCPEPKVLDWQQ